MPQRFPYPPGTTCSRCPVVLDKERRHRYCRDCSNAYKREHRLLPHAKAKEIAIHRERAYGITAEEYAALLDGQGGLCAVCSRPETAKRRGIVKTLAVDHDHDTGAIRGLLCTKCNTAIGLLDDSEERIAALARYMAANRPSSESVA